MGVITLLCFFQAACNTSHSTRAIPDTTPILLLDIFCDTLLEKVGEALMINKHIKPIFL